MRRPTMPLIRTRAPMHTRGRGARLALVMAISAFIGLAFLEATLRLAPGIVSGELANAVLSRYHSGPGGIYFRDADSGMCFMRPDLATSCYWNGHVWQHRSDSMGYRNPVGTSTHGLILAGDSMIYGHGVDEDATVSHLLRSEHGRAAYNIALQGDTLYQEYVRARLALAQFRPEHIVLFVFLNDFDDMAVHRSPEQIATAPELEQLDFAALAGRVGEPGEDGRLEQIRRLRVWRLFKGLRTRHRAAPPAARAPDEFHPFVASILDDVTFAPVAGYYRRVLGDLGRRAREQSVDLTVVLLDIGDGVDHFVVPSMIPAQDRVFALLSEIGDENEFRVLSTREVFADCNACFLQNDGHMTREGHRRLAAFVDQEVPRHPTRVP